ncbi:LysR family transcriptional regulator [Uliginosibacterium sp. sgz301328]|uniref:LysR family transcriptional regulator n=1 Tax=Uliginosibacterium sp. sgz301328 TaxID=3243764 RepID=UPI00359E5DDC
MQWEDVRYFLAVARQGSLSGAARTMAVEHSTVARRIEALESSLGLRLFDRLPRGWRLTAEGEELVTLGERIEDEALAFERAAVGAGTQTGRVRVSAPPTLVSQFLMPRLAATRAQWSGIELEVIGETREANLARREADIALRMGRPQSLALAARLIGKVGYGLYGRREWLEKPPHEWEFVSYDHSMRNVPQQKWLEDYAGGRRFALRSNDLAAIVSAAAAGLGVTFMTHYLARTQPTLVRLAPDEGPPSREVWLVLHPDVRRSPRVRLIADLIVGIFERDAALLT